MRRNIYCFGLGIFQVEFGRMTKVQTPWGTLVCIKSGFKKRPNWKNPNRNRFFCGMASLTNLLMIFLQNIWNPTLKLLGWLKSYGNVVIVWQILGFGKWEDFVSAQTRQTWKISQAPQACKVFRTGVNCCPWIYAVLSWIKLQFCAHFSIFVR